MNLQSFDFLLFFIVVFVSYYTFAKKNQNLLLLIASLAFCYFVGGFVTLKCIILTTITTFFCAILTKKYANTKIKNLFLIAGIFFNTAILFYMKYSAFFFGDDFSSKIIAPVGISFYTLQCFSYLIDTYWSVTSVELNFVKYATFSTYFPQLISGPISRYNDLGVQFNSPRKFDFKNLFFGTERMVWGYFKKMVIADRISKIVDLVYSNNGFETYSGYYILISTVCFAIQLYTDFSGCIDIIAGASEILNIKLAENFTTPFFSKSLSEFWRRWHITLGTWCKDYILYPILKTNLFVKLGDFFKAIVGKKQGKKIPTYIGLIVLWFSVGFWHGGYWKYIIGSGLLHCFYIVTGQILDPSFKKLKTFLRINDKHVIYSFFQRIRTFCLVCSGFVFFRSKDVPTAINTYKNIFKINYDSFSLTVFDLSKSELICLLIGLLILISASHIQQKVCIREELYKHKVLNYIGLFIMIMFIVGLGASQNPSFIYVKF